MTNREPAARRFPPQAWGSLVALLLLIAGGVGYRAGATVLGVAALETVRLDPPLKTLPLMLGDWIGADVEISAAVQRIAKNDDYVSRRYQHRVTGRVANLYIAYTGRPRTMQRHRPTVCYPSAGWMHVDTRVIAVPQSPPGHTFAALSHLFRKPALGGPQAVVLNYYVLNGSLTIDEGSFWSLMGRDPNLRGDASRYIAQVQVMVPVSTGEDGARSDALEFLHDAAAPILALLPGSLERFLAAP